MQQITILGSTGSIGTQTLDIIRENRSLFKVYALSCHSSIQILERQIAEFSPEVVVITDPSQFSAAKAMLSSYPKLKMLLGKDALLEIVSAGAVDAVVISIVGNEALLPTIEAIKAKKRICIANKEVLVTSGHLIMPLAKSLDVTLYPVDSEHSALFQCLQGNELKSIEKVILTASGGPFRGMKKNDLIAKVASEALKHPKWQMGQKISIDSATLMNKGLEVIEAKWLFDLEPSQIEVVVHPESIIHSMIQYKDRSVMAQMGLPDMKLPILYALTHPKRIQTNLEPLDLTKIVSLNFEAPDHETFPCLSLAYKALEMGGLTPTVLNASNEVLVERYLKGEVSFYDIPEGIEKAMLTMDLGKDLSLEAVLETDAAARRYAYEWKR